MSQDIDKDKDKDIIVEFIGDKALLTLFGEVSDYRNFGKVIIALKMIELVSLCHKRHGIDGVVAANNIVGTWTRLSAKTAYINEKIIAFVASIGCVLYFFTTPSFGIISYMLLLIPIIMVLFVSELATAKNEQGASELRSMAHLSSIVCASMESPEVSNTITVCLNKISSGMIRD